MYFSLCRWRIELNQNALNSAEEETEPLLSSENRPMSPTSYSPREATTASGSGVYRPVVGYIQVANSRNYGSALNTSPSVMRTLENPSLYNSQPREVAPQQQQQSPRHFWSSRLNVEQTQSHVSRSVEERDLFQPPPPPPPSQPDQK